MPEAPYLALLRRDVDRKSHKLKRVLMEPGLRKEFFGGIPKDEKKVVKAFANQNTENALKTKPKVSSTLGSSPLEYPSQPSKCGSLRFSCSPSWPDVGTY